MGPRSRVRLLTVVLGACLCSNPAQAQTPADKPGSQPAAGSDADLAKQLSNPVASLVSVPLQFNWDQPLHFTISKLTRFGPFPMSVGGAVAPFVAAPGGRPDFRVRFVATLLLPRK